MRTFIDHFLGDKLGGLTKALDLQMKRHEAIASNISNAETPQYRAVDVTFAGELKKAYGQSSGELVKTNGKHMELSENDSSHLVPDYSGATRADGNNVDIDIQMAKLADTGIKYSIAANLVRRKMQSVRDALMQGI
ncbi:MAG: flagellar basal body rod protein FlgB [Deltaproteobacteria bacterium]|nr:flagellar basal body rod protein FlgB [Deltaproteobacteria bacterium]